MFLTHLKADDDIALLSGKLAILLMPFADPRKMPLLLNGRRTPVADRTHDAVTMSSGIFAVH